MRTTSSACTLVASLIMNTSASHAQIAALSTMKDSQRLALLKEVGGTKIYEERRHDSLKLMAESEGRSQRIQEVVSRASCPP